MENEVDLLNLLDMQEWDSIAEWKSIQSSFYWLFIYWHRSLIKSIVLLLICMMLGSAHSLTEAKKTTTKKTMLAWCLRLKSMRRPNNIDHLSSTKSVNCFRGNATWLILPLDVMWSNFAAKTCLYFSFFLPYSEWGFQLCVQQNDNKRVREKKESKRKNNTREEQN